jgi:hypothetical protein
MLKNKTEIIFITLGLAVAGTLYFLYLKKNKSFLEMDEFDKRKFVEDEAKKRMEIDNDPNLTQQQKIEAQERLNKINVIKLSDEEKKAIADFNVQRLVSGETTLKKGSLSWGGISF